jgi:uncharacterized protein YrrD
VTGDPVAWVVIEEGWKVVGRNREDLGYVKEIFGDEKADIFDGLLVTHGLIRKDRYVPAERVTAIYEGLIETDLDDDQLQGLEGSAPGSVRAIVR